MEYCRTGQWARMVFVLGACAVSLCGQCVKDAHTVFIIGAPLCIVYKPWNLVPWTCFQLALLFGSPRLQVAYWAGGGGGGIWQVQNLEQRNVAQQNCTTFCRGF